MNLRPFRFAKPEWIPSLITWLGVMFFLAYLTELLVFYGLSSIYSVGALVGFFVSAVFFVPLAYGGHRLEESSISPQRYPRIANWIIGGLVFYLGINLPLMAVFPSSGLEVLIGWGRWAANVGATTGLLVGSVESRAIQRELDAQCAVIRADEAENQRRWLDYLNGLLRHEVLNTANVIVGYASLLLEDDDLDDATRTQLETIHRQGENMTKVIRDVQVLIEATSDITRFEPVNLSNALDGELDQLRDAYESVTVETSIPDDVTVVADELLPRIFSNLLRNAVEHNDSDRPEVRVNVERNDDTTTVQIADNGPGIPENERPTLFERGDNTGAKHGLGLYLVRTLVERYGGAVELTETGTDGSVFTVELPIADATPDSSHTDSGRADNGRTDAGHADVSAK